MKIEIIEPTDLTGQERFEGVTNRGFYIIIEGKRARAPMSSEIYTCKPTPHPNTYAMTKFTNELDPRSTYIVSDSECNCPRGELGKPCRHRDMLRHFSRSKHIGDGWFYNWSTRQWIKPVEDFEPAQDEPQPVAVAPEPEVPSLPPAPAVNGSGASLRRRPWNG
jgi:hypothetical protein